MARKWRWIGCLWRFLKYMRWTTFLRYYLHYGLFRLLTTFLSLLPLGEYYNLPGHCLSRSQTQAFPRWGHVPMRSYSLRWTFSLCHSLVKVAHLFWITKLLCYPQSWASNHWTFCNLPHYPFKTVTQILEMISSLLKVLSFTSMYWWSSIWCYRV